jgi:hypothetical protein
MKAFFPREEAKHKDVHFHHFYSTGMEVLARAIRQKKK